MTMTPDRGVAVELAYGSGFGNEFATEALAGALPQGRNSPQHPPFGLYAEQLSGTAFTAPRAVNRRSWLYRIRPAAMHEAFRCLDIGRWSSGTPAEPTSPNQLRWNAPVAPGASTDFVAGLTMFACNGDPAQQNGCAVGMYVADLSMTDRYLFSGDGEWLIVPQRGRLRLRTEFGVLAIEPSEFAVVPRGVRFAVDLLDGSAAGYVCENFGAFLRLPDLGPIGANGLANARDFLSPVAAFEDIERPGELVAKYMGHWWSAQIDHSPLDVVAWHGNYAPYKYDLRRFNTLGTVSFDHPDPSIYLVLHSPSDTLGVDNLDLVVFPPRWLVAEQTFRPPWFHRNTASEFMGLISGAYDGKADGFVPGGASLHNAMSGHGPDRGTVERAVAADTSIPQHIADSLAFMFESRWVLHPTQHALNSPSLQPAYARCWNDLPKRFVAPGH